MLLQVTLEQRVPQSATAVRLEAANWELFCDYPRRVSAATTALLAMRFADEISLAMGQPVSLPYSTSAALAGCGPHVQAPGESLGCHACCQPVARLCPKQCSLQIRNTMVTFSQAIPEGKLFLLPTPALKVGVLCLVCI